MKFLQSMIEHTLESIRLFSWRLAPAAAPQDSPSGRMAFSQNSSDPGKKPVIRAGRRRPAGPSGGPTERADAPRRDRETPSTGPSYTGGGPTGTSGGSGMMPSLGGLLGSPKRMGCLGIILLIAIAVVLFSGGLDLSSLLGGSSDPYDSGNTGPYIEQPTTAYIAPTQRPTSRPSTSGLETAGGDTWLILLYQDADDKVLEQDIYIDLNEAERVGSSENVQIVAQVDRFYGGYSGDGNWTSTRRFYITQDNDLTRVNSQLIQDLGEANMADGNTLVDFATWAIQQYPADKVALILSDHGMGWPGGWSDPTATGRGDSRLPLASAIGDQLYLHEIDAALEKIRTQTGLDKFELIGMDACLMGHIEVLDALADHGRYAVTSQETEPSLGWAYASFLEELASNPSMSGADLGRYIVDSYIEDDERIQDSSARSEFVGRGSPLSSFYGGAPSADQIVRQLTPTTTLAVVDLSAVPELIDAVNNFSFVLQGTNQRAVARARSYSQSFTSIFGTNVPPSYIDLGHFVQLAAQAAGESRVTQAAEGVLDALEKAVVAEKHGSKKPGATGISIYFPNSQLYQTAQAGPQSYNVAASQFVNDSLWDEFLAYHYTKKSFEADQRSVTIPDAGVAVRGPASGGITVSPLSLSADTVAPEGSVILSADISGENIGYIKLLVGLLDTASNSIYVADSDYLDVTETLELNGVYYPRWGSTDFTLEFEWEPILYGLTDGETTAVALFMPTVYGQSREEAVYMVEGMYTDAANSDTRYARMFFSNGVLQQVFGFTGTDATGAPREIIPQVGDTFTILDRWMDLDSEGNVTQVIQQEGETLTFGSQTFTWKELYAPAGQFVIGYIVEDLDGQGKTTVAPITVR